MAEDEMVAWNRQLDGPEFEQALGIADAVTNKEAWHAAVRGVSKSRTVLSN